jgi:hypothetical protein
VEQDVAFDGMKHIVSPCCQEHGGLFVEVANQFCGVHEGDILPHIQRIDDYLYQAQSDGCEPIEKNLALDFLKHNLDYFHLRNEISATDHNTRNHKMAHVLLTILSCMPYVEILSHIDDKQALLSLFVLYYSTPLNKISDLGDIPYNLLGKIPHCIVDKQTSFSPNCLCTIYEKYHQETSHFATFPEKLIEPCVLAGCPKDGVVYDPFGGAMTTPLVALRAGRKFIASELNPEYCKIGYKRIKNLLDQYSLDFRVSF